MASVFFNDKPVLARVEQPVLETQFLNRPEEHRGREGIERLAGKARKYQWRSDAGWNFFH
jgi:hypothetical protein